MSCKSIIFGATGMVGEGVLHVCLHHPDVESVLVISRKPCGLKDDKLKEIASSNVRGLVEKLAESKNVHAIVFDGIVTKRLLEEAGKQGVKYIVGVKKGKIEKAEGIRVITM